MYKVNLRSRHGTHQPLKQFLPSFKERVVLRLGSFTTTETIYSKIFGKKPIIEINSVEAITNSANKLLMKQKFTEADVKTADWWRAFTDLGTIKFVHEGIENRGTELINQLPYPIVSKHIFGSRGTGNKLHQNKQSLEAFLVGKDLSKYIFEAFFSGVREYRLHVGKGVGWFYTCRKVLKTDTPDGERWHRHEVNCNWIKEENPLFDKPINWEEIVADCEKALDAIGLDVGAFDIKVQSAKNKKGEPRETIKYILIEVNSAPSFGETTLEKYREFIPKIINYKTNGTTEL